MSLDLDLPGVNHAWIQAVKFWRETTGKICSSHPIILRECMRVVCPIMRMLVLISYGHVCQELESYPRLLCRYHLVGRYLEPMEDLVFLHCFVH